MTREGRPWTFAAVCIMVIAMTVLLFGLSWGPADALTPVYFEAYLLIGTCIFGPAGKWPSLAQAAAFLLPGVVLALLALLGAGFWCGLWLLGLPGWGVLLARTATEGRLPTARILTFLGLLVVGSLVLVLTGFYLFLFAPAVLLLPVISLVRVAHPYYKENPLRPALEIFLAVAAVVLAIALPNQPGSWTSLFTYAGGATVAGLMIGYWATRTPLRFAQRRVNHGVRL